MLPPPRSPIFPACIRLHPVYACAAFIPEPVSLYIRSKIPTEASDARASPFPRLQRCDTSKSFRRDIPCNIQAFLSINIDSKAVIFPRVGLLWITNIYCINYAILIISIFIRLTGFIILMIGRRSNSTFSLMGSIHFIAQSISCEVRFILIYLLFGHFKGKALFR